MKICKMFWCLSMLNLLSIVIHILKCQLRNLFIGSKNSEIQVLDRYCKWGLIFVIHLYIKNLTYLFWVWYYQIKKLNSCFKYLCFLNLFRCGDILYRWKMCESPRCDYGAPRQMMNHIFTSCLLRYFPGGAEWDH